jgi:hypothetical protein
MLGGSLAADEIELGDGNSPTLGAPRRRRITISGVQYSPKAIEHPSWGAIDIPEKGGGESGSWSSSKGRHLHTILTLSSMARTELPTNPHVIGDRQG